MDSAVESFRPETYFKARVLQKALGFFDGGSVSMFSKQVIFGMIGSGGEVSNAF